MAQLIRELARRAGPGEDFNWFRKPTAVTGLEMMTARWHDDLSPLSEDKWK